MKTETWKRVPLLCAIAGLMFAAHPRAEAQTDVSGTLVNQTWTSTNSPYIVVGNINVAGLTILPGVTVQFAGNYSFEVDGVLQAQGNPNSPIIFKAGTKAGWQGIFFNDTGPGSVLASCIISNSINSGIRILDSNPTITGCVITSNSAEFGGGINADISSGDLAITDSIIANNASHQDATADRCGGGIYAMMESTVTGPNRLVMTGCIISNNAITPTTGYGSAYGGGCWVGGNALFERCIIVSNSCIGNVDVNVIGGVAAGGGVCASNGSIVLNNTILRGNFSSGPDQTAYGGGLIVEQGLLAMTNCIVQENVASPDYNPAGGGGICIGIIPDGFGGAAGNAVSGLIVNSTIAYNQIFALAVGTSSKMTLLNSIVFFNGTASYGSVAATYCDVQGGLAGAGNINRNPVFLNTTDLIIVPGSPCIDAGNTNAAYNDVLFPPSLGTQLNDMGAHGGAGAGAIFQLRAWPQIEVSLFGGVPGYTYLIQASTDLLNWQTVEQFQIAHVGDVTNYFEPTTNTLPQRFYRLNLAQ